MAMTKLEARNTIIKCAKLYAENMCNKELLFIYFINSKIQFINVSYSPTNYKHLTGIESNCNPTNFFNYCLNSQITEHQINFKKNGTTILKLKVLENIMNIAHRAKFLGDYLDSHVYLELDKVIGNIACGLGVGKKATHYYPKSVLHGDIRQQLTNAHKISAVFEKTIGKSDYKLIRIAKSLSEEHIQKIHSLLEQLKNQ